LTIDPVAASCQPTRDLRGSTRDDRRGGGGGGGEEAGDAGSRHGLSVPREVLVEGSDEVGAPSHEPPAIGSDSAGCVSDRRRQPDQQLDQQAGKASNESMKVGSGGSVGGKEPVSA
jgi:hypothetical protein